MIKLSFQISEKLLPMKVIIINILEKSCKKAIYDKLILSNDKKKPKRIQETVKTFKWISEK